MHIDCVGLGVVEGAGVVVGKVGGIEVGGGMELVCRVLGGGAVDGMLHVDVEGGMEDVEGGRVDELVDALVLLVEDVETSCDVDTGGQLKKVCTGTTSTQVEGIVIGIPSPALPRIVAAVQNKGTQQRS